MTKPLTQQDREAAAAGGSIRSAAAGTSTAVPFNLDARTQVFQQVKPFTSQLLQLKNSSELQSNLQQLTRIIQKADAEGLNSKGCMDYILFPLMFGVDSIAVMRKPGEKSASTACAIPAVRSDAVAEALLDCCHALLQRCPAQSGEQLLELLDRFAGVAGLPSGTASEEVRLKAIQCMGALVTNLPSRPSSLGPAASLRDPTKAPMLAFLFSSLMSAAEGEVQAGLKGSKGLSAAALHALCALIQAVGDGNALAFVLPGLASSLAKILLAAGNSRRPAGSRIGTCTAVEALQAFAAIARATVGDKHAQAVAAAQHQAPELSANDALSALAKLAMQLNSSGQSAGIAQDQTSGHQALPAGRSRTMRPARDKAWLQASASRLQLLISQALPPLAAHPRPAVRIALAKAVAMLLDHCSTVLSEAAEALYEVLFSLAQDDWPQVSSFCQTWLRKHATDTMQAEAVPQIVQRLEGGLVAAVQSGEEAATLHARRLTTALQACSPQQLAKLLMQSPGALNWAATVCRCFAFERSAAAILLYNTSQAGPHAAFGTPTPSAPISSPAASSASPQADLHQQQQQPCTKRSTEDAQHREHDAPGSDATADNATGSRDTAADNAILMQTASRQPSAAISSNDTAHTSISPQKTSDNRPSPTAMKAPEQRAMQGPEQRTSAQAAVRDQSSSPDVAAVLLPRMQLGLKHITGASTYTAVAGVARRLAVSAQAADHVEATFAGGVALHGIAQDLLQAFEAEVPHHLAQHQGRRNQLPITRTQPQAKVGWQGRAAASVVALTEILYGASPAWQAAHAQSLIRTATGSSEPSTGHSTSAAHDLSPTPATKHNETNASHSTHAANGSSPASHDSISDSSPGCSVGSHTSSHASLEGQLVSHSHDGHNPLTETDDAGQQQRACHFEHQIASADSGGHSPLGKSDAAEQRQRSGDVKLQMVELERLVEQAVDSFGNSGVWQVPTHADPDAAQDGLTPQVLGENAILIRALLEAIGTYARVLGPHFASNGLILRKVLLLLLERLADPCPSVATSAGAALGSVCLHCGYGSRQDLLTANADYLVDGLCRQLRLLELHPRAPYLFAAVLQQTGAGPQLLPLLADPARAAFQGLSITARHNRAFHIYPFLQVLMHIVAICEAEAAALYTATQAAAEEVKQALAAVRSNPDADDGEEPNGEEGLSRIDAVRAYFVQHHRQKAQSAAAEAETSTEFDPGESAMEEWSDRRRRVHSVAVLAHASADVSNPLLLSATLKVALLASRVGLTALKALHGTTAALKLYENVLTPISSKQEGVGPPAPDTPQMLPSVHAMWGPLMGALKDSRPALVAAALECLAGVCGLAGGQFMMRRLQTEAWPVMCHLMKHGVHEPHGPPYHAGRQMVMAPAGLQHMRFYVLRCISQLSDIAQPPTVWKGMTDKVAEAAAVYLEINQTSAVKEASVQAILAIARLDPDAVWLLLYLRSDQNMQNPDPTRFPDAQRLCSQTQSKQLRSTTDTNLIRKLMNQVEQMQASWHSLCDD